MDNVHIRTPGYVDRAAPQHPDGRDAVERAIHRIVELPHPAHRDGAVPCCGEALRSGPVAQAIGRAATHTDGAGCLSDRAHRLERANEALLDCRRPAVGAVALLWDGPEGEDCAGEQRGG
jgi:hypothetical protein